MNKENNKRQEALISFKKAKSLLETMIRMTEEGKYCVDIMQQNLAVIGLLKSAHEKLMNNHLETCFSAGMKSGKESRQAQMILEIEQLMKLGNK